MGVFMKLKSGKVSNTRINKGMSPEYIGCKIGVSQPQYSRIENGECSVSLDKVIEISKILEVSPTDIIDCNNWQTFNNCSQSGNIDTINNNQDFGQERQAYIEQIEYLKEQNLEILRILHNLQKD